MRAPARTPGLGCANSALPAVRMFLAAFTSAWSRWWQEVHTKTAWLLRDSASTCLHAWHVWDVYAGLTVITWVPVYRALLRVAASIRYQPLSKMARFRPDLAAAPLGRNAPSLSGSGFGAAA